MLREIIKNRVYYVDTLLAQLGFHHIMYSITAKPPELKRTVEVRLKPSDLAKIEQAIKSMQEQIILLQSAADAIIANPTIQTIIRLIDIMKEGYLTFSVLAAQLYGIDWKRICRNMEKLYGEDNDSELIEDVTTAIRRRLFDITGDFEWLTYA